MEPDGQPLSDRARPALLVVDMLNDFVSGPFAGPGSAALVPRVRAAVDRARALGIPVIHVCDAHAPDDAEFAVLGPHAIAGTSGAEIVEALAPRPGEPVVRKQRYSGFFETELDAVLREAGADTLVLTGLQTDCCIRHTAADGFFRGFRIAIASDAVGARTEEGHRSALAEARRLYGARVDTAAAVLDAAPVRG